MKKSCFFLTLSILCTVIMLGCQSSPKEYITREYPTKVVQPQAPFLDENIESVGEHLDSTVDRNATVAAKAVSLPIRFVDKFSEKVQGISDANPYDRAEPYSHKDFQKEMLAESMKGITQPEYIRGARYAASLRAPFLFSEDEVHKGTTGMATVSEASASDLAKRYFDIQRDLEDELNRAETYLAEGKYSEALECVDKVMDLDTSSEEGRILFEKIIRAREEARITREEEMRETIAINEKISRYLSEARTQFDAGDYDEALRIAQKALSLDGQHERARELVDTIELAQFENKLKMSGTSSFEVLERMIYKHLRLYQQYMNESLTDLAQKELQKVSVLESYRDKVATLQE